MPQAPSLGLVGAGGAQAFVSSLAQMLAERQALAEREREFKLRERGQGERERANRASEALTGRSVGVSEERVGLEGARDAETRRRFDEANARRIDFLNMRSVNEDPTLATALRGQAAGFDLSPDTLRSPEELGAREGARNLSAFNAGGREVAEGEQGIRTAGQLEVVRNTPRTPVPIVNEAGETVYSDPQSAIGQPVGTRTAAKPPTGAQDAALGYYNRMKDAIGVLDQVEGNLSTEDLAIIHSSLPLPRILENPALSSDGRAYLQALRVYTEARLRKESGAAIPESEYVTDRLAIARNVGDDQRVIDQKRATRYRTADGIAFAAGPAYENYYGSAYEPGQIMREAEAARGGGLAPGTEREVEGVVYVWDGTGWKAKEEEPAPLGIQRVP